MLISDPSNINEALRLAYIQIEAMHEMIDGRDKDIAQLHETVKDARMLATAVIDAGVGCLAPEEMRAIAARIIAANPF